jgi:hypothetical protein
MAENLEQIIGAVTGTGIKYQEITGLAKAFSEKPADYPLIAKYVQMAYGGDVKEGSAKQMFEDFKKASPALVRENMDASASDFKSQLTKIVSENYEALISGLPEQYLLQAVLGVSGKAKEAEAVEEAIKSRKFDEVRDKFAKAVAGSSKAHAHYIKNIAGDAFLANFAPSYFQMEYGKFLQSFMAAGKSDEESRLDVAKIKQYLTEAPGKAKDDKAKEGIYFEFGNAIAKYQFAQMKAAEEAKKAEEKKGK